MRQIAGTSPESDAFSRDLKHRWFDGRMRPYAGRRHGKRSPHRLFPLSPDPVAIRKHWEDWIHFSSIVAMSKGRRSGLFAELPPIWSE